MNDEFPRLDCGESFQRWLKEQYAPDEAKDAKARELRAENLKRFKNQGSQRPARVS